MTVTLERPKSTPTVEDEFDLDIQLQPGIRRKTLKPPMATASGIEASCCITENPIDCYSEYCGGGGSVGSRVVCYE